MDRDNERNDGVYSPLFKKVTEFCRNNVEDQFGWCEEFVTPLFWDY